MIAERITNVLKMRNDDLRIRKLSESDERVRELRIQTRSLTVCIFVAVLLKADIFTIIAHLEEPWRTLGWVRVTGAQWFQTPSLGGVDTAIYSIVGCVFTGFALGFGSKFWHDILGSVYEMRDKVRRGRFQSLDNSEQPAITPPPEGSNDA
jgi:hypothetical protein